MRPQLPLLSLSALLLAASAFACTNAPSTEAGGDPRFNPSPPASSDDGGDGACGNPNADAGFGSGWSDLYRDYFGTSGVASCAGTVGACHGETTGLGYQASNYLCPPGSVSGCYTGMTSQAAGLVTPADDPVNSGLYAVLRKECGGGVMPLKPATVEFSAADMKRISDWIGAGAPNN